MARCTCFTLALEERIDGLDFTLGCENHEFIVLKAFFLPHCIIKILLCCLTDGEFERTRV